MIRAEPMIGEDHIDRMERGNLFEQVSNMVIKDAIAFPYFLQPLRFVVLICAGSLDVPPEFVLDPIGLLEMNHENIPFSCAQKMGSERSTLLKTADQLVDKTVEFGFRLRWKVIPQRQV